MLGILQIFQNRNTHGPSVWTAGSWHHRHKHCCYFLTYGSSLIQSYKTSPGWHTPMTGNMKDKPEWLSWEVSKRQNSELSMLSASWRSCYNCITVKNYPSSQSYVPLFLFPAGSCSESLQITGSATNSESQNLFPWEPNLRDQVWSLEGDLEMWPWNWGVWKQTGSDENLITSWS